MFGLGSIVRMNNSVSNKNGARTFASNLTRVVNASGDVMFLSYGYYPVLIKYKGVNYVNSQKVSPTTTRHTSKALKAVGYGDVHYMSTEQMIALSYKAEF